MANALYPLGKKAFLDADIDMLVDTIKVALIDTGTYTYSSAHQFLSSASAGVVGTAVTLGTKTTTGGVFDAADTTFGATFGATCEAIIVYKDTGSAATSPLIAYFDAGVTGLPVTPNGGPIDIGFNVSGIFAL